MKNFEKMKEEIIKKFSYMLKCITELIFKNKSKNKFYNNSPRVDLLYKDQKIYFDALQEAIKNRAIYNVSLSGEYSSGKSSIIDSFIIIENRFINGLKNKNKFLKISLADFRGKEISEATQKLLEEKILQQIIYNKTNYTVPNSGFKRIEKENLISQVTLHLFYLLLGINIFNKTIHLKYPEYSNINNIIESIFEAFFKLTYKISVVNLKIMTFLVMTIFFLSKIYAYIKRNKINIKSIGKGSVELFSDKEEKEIFNKYLSEVLYYFQCTKINVVFIEDLDRIDCNKELFLKLRELNFLINNSDQVKQKVVFIYAVRNNIFDTMEENSKFFEFNIPIIPVVDKYNIQDYILKLAEDIGIKEKFSETYFWDISKFFKNIREINNVFNDYIFYKNSLSLFDYEMGLFSMMIIKNLAPKEFKEFFHEGKDFLTDLIQIKENINKRIRGDDKIAAIITEKGTIKELLINREDLEFDLIFSNESKNWSVKQILLEIEKIKSHNKIIVELFFKGYIEEKIKEQPYFRKEQVPEEIYRFIEKAKSSEKIKYKFLLSNVELLIKCDKSANFMKKNAINYYVFNFFLKLNKNNSNLDLEKVKNEYIENVINDFLENKMNFIEYLVKNNKIPYLEKYLTINYLVNYHSLITKIIEKNKIISLELFEILKKTPAEEKKMSHLISNY